MGVYVEIKLKNYLKLIILCGQQRNSQEKINNNNKLVQASDFELQCSLNTVFYSFGGASACWYLKHNFGDVYQKQKSNSSPECTDGGYFDLFLVWIGWTGECVLSLEGKHWKKRFSWLSILKCCHMLENDRGDVFLVCFVRRSIIKTE